MANKDIIGLSDPYVEVRIQSVDEPELRIERKTTVKDDNLNPDWDEILEMYVGLPKFCPHWKFTF